jgi:hypothetical protein
MRTGFGNPGSSWIRRPIDRRQTPKSLHIAFAGIRRPTAGSESIINFVPRLGNDGANNGASKCAIKVGGIFAQANKSQSATSMVFSNVGGHGCGPDMTTQGQAKCICKSWREKESSRKPLRIL